MISGNIALYILKTPELRKELDKFRLVRVIAYMDWSEKNAMELVEIILEEIITWPSEMIDSLYYLREFGKRFPMAGLKIFTKNSLIKLEKKDYSKIGYILKDFYDPILNHIGVCETVSEELRGYLTLAVDSQETINEYNKSYTGLRDLKIKYRFIFEKLEQKALNGNREFQILVAELCRQDTPFSKKDLKKTCAFLYKAFLNGSEDALTILSKIDNEEDNAEIKYTLGKMYLDKQEIDMALAFFLQVSSNHELYDEAMFECGNIQFCIQKNKEQALDSFSKINKPLGESFNASLLMKACQIDSSASIIDLYSHCTERPLLSCSSDKKITIDKIEFLWEKYQTVKNGKFFKKTCEITEGTYTIARSAIYNDVGRYRVIREYFLDKNNQKKYFYKILEKEFGHNFFQEKNIVEESYEIVKQYNQLKELINYLAIEDRSQITLENIEQIGKLIGKINFTCTLVEKAIEKNCLDYKKNCSNPEILLLAHGDKEEIRAWCELQNKTELFAKVFSFDAVSMKLSLKSEYKDCNVEILLEQCIFPYLLTYLTSLKGQQKQFHQKCYDAMMDPDKDINIIVNEYMNYVKDGPDYMKVNNPFVWVEGMINNESRQMMFVKLREEAIRGPNQSPRYCSSTL
jgi:hypothetical protein